MGWVYAQPSSSSLLQPACAGYVAKALPVQIGAMAHGQLRPALHGSSRPRVHVQRPGAGMQSHAHSHGGDCVGSGDK
jgi:hypothetical protein